MRLTVYFLVVNMTQPVTGADYSMCVSDMGSGDEVFETNVTGLTSEQLGM